MNNPETGKPYRYVILRGIAWGNRFFSTHNPDGDERYLVTGELAYDILGYAETVYDAQKFLYGEIVADNLARQRVTWGRSYNGE